MEPALNAGGEPSPEKQEPDDTQPQAKPPAHGRYDRGSTTNVHNEPPQHAGGGPPAGAGGKPSAPSNTCRSSSQPDTGSSAGGRERDRRGSCQKQASIDDDVSAMGCSLNEIAGKGEQQDSNFESYVAAMSKTATHSNDNDVTTTELEPIVSAKDAQPSGAARCPSHRTNSDSSRDQGRRARHLINPRSTSRGCWREGPLNNIKHWDAWEQQQTRKKWAPRDQTAPTALMSQNSARPPGKSPVDIRGGESYRTRASKRRAPAAAKATAGTSVPAAAKAPAGMMAPGGMYNRPRHDTPTPSSIAGSAAAEADRNRSAARESCRGGRAEIDRHRASSASGSRSSCGGASCRKALLCACNTGRRQARATQDRATCRF